MKLVLHYDKIGWENAKIELIENFPCDSKQELEDREYHYIGLLQPKLNTMRIRRKKVIKDGS